MLKIFVTNGTQLPFQRLTESVENFVINSLNLRAEVVIQDVGQINRAPRGNCRYVSFLSPSEYESYCTWCDVVVAHAGMGTIISACESGKPLIMLPRRFDMGEHRNDHQVTTAQRFSSLEGVYVAESEEEVARLLHQYNKLVACQAEGGERRERLTSFVRDFING